MAVLPSHHLAPLLVRQAAANTTTTTLPLPLPQQSLDLSTYPTTPLQQFGLFLIIFFPALSVVFVSLRIYDRFKTKTFGADDYFIIAAGILAALSAVISWYMMRMQYIGIHLWQIPPPGTFNPRNGMIVNYIVVVLYNPQLALVKSSVLFFLLRLGGHQRGLRKGIQVLNWSNIALMVAVLFASIFTCVPVYKYWDKSVEGGVCNNEAMQYLVTSGLTILTDVLVLIIPIKIVWGLQVAKKLKIILICLLCSGIVVTVFSILRMRAIYFLYYPPADRGDDFTHDIAFVYSSIECNLAIITASIPPLHGLMRKWFPRFFQLTSAKNSNLPYGGGASGSRGLQTIGGSSFALRDLRSPSARSHKGSRLGSMSNSEEEMLGKNPLETVRTVERSGSVEDDVQGGMIGAPGNGGKF